jgi:hypothetical protein
MFFADDRATAPAPGAHAPLYAAESASVLPGMRRRITTGLTSDDRVRVRAFPEAVERHGVLATEETFEAGELIDVLVVNLSGTTFSTTPHDGRAFAIVEPGGSTVTEFN